MSTAPVNGNCAGDNTSTAEWLSTVTSLLEKFGVFQPDRNSKVVDFLHPAALEKRIDLSLQENGSDKSTLLQLCKDVIQWSVKTNHPNFYNQLYGATDPYGLVGNLIADALNTNQYTYEVAPMLTICERKVLVRSLKLFGFCDGDGILAPGETYCFRITFEIAPVFICVEGALFNRMLFLFGIPDGEGMFAPGGSLSNMYAMMLARHRICPEAKKKGIIHCKPFAVFTSSDAHYSIQKGVSWLGIGLDNLFHIPCDDRGRMIPSELDVAIEKAKMQGLLPLMVNATAGTTVLGAIDPIEEIADVCEKHGVWLHVDGCWGASFIFSAKYKKDFKSISRADSVAWNPHKMLGAPLQCSIFLNKHKGLLHECNCAGASYLFQQDKFYDVSYDTGDKSLQCGRKVDCFKFWLMWKARGDVGFQRLVNNAVTMAQYFLDKISKRDGFRLVVPELQCTNVCFWYIPKRLRGLPETEEWRNELDKIAPKVKESLTLAGTLMIGYQPIKHRQLNNFFRLVITCHPERSESDMDHIINEVEKYGEMS